MSRICFAIALCVLSLALVGVSGCSNADSETQIASAESDHEHAGAEGHPNTAGHDQGGQSNLPASEEEQLYLLPGGIYTVADIAANGGMTATKKFASFSPKHDLRPKPGDKICPITLTKANAECTWVVGGKTYEFCCPPCVEEFVKLAKESPEEIKEPVDYVKK